MYKEGFNTKTPILKRWLPDRQVYFRQNGEVRFLTLSSTVQAIIAGALFAFGTWIVFSTAHVFTRDAVLEAKQEKIEDLQAANGQQSDDMNMLKSDVLFQTNNLEHRQTYIENLMENDPTGDLANQDAAVTNTPEETETDKESNASASQADEMFWAQFSGQNNEPVSPVELGVEEFAAHINARLEVVEARQNQSADILSQFAEAQLLEADDMLAPFKLKALDLANAVEEDTPFPGQGGPFIPVGENGFGMNFAAAVDDTYYIPYPDLHENWTRLTKVYTGFRSLPISRPAADYYMSSDFGRRVDPVTNQSGWHPGVDLAGWKGTDVFATEDGIVTKAGHYGTYGKYIEVDHGNGFITRYGHLSKITVNRGETVKAGDVIGKMGCTGRCTGTHLHYEVVFNGKIRNPQIFMEAPEDVQETKRQSISNDSGK